MNITIFGSGYVGLATGACLAEAGNNVLCVDVNDDKVEALRRGEIDIYESGLPSLVQDNAAAGRLRFSTDVKAGVAHGELQFIAVGTPSAAEGNADLEQVWTVARSIGQHMDGFKLIVNKSTVPVGTADRVREVVAGVLRDRGADHDFDVVSNPEFLKEGSAVKDFMKPDRIIVGAQTHASAERMKALYSPFNRNHDRLQVMDIRSAELSKYAANAMLATRISFMNELANIARRVGADIEQVRIGIGSDPRIGYAFLYAGAGYGGSCLPKDVRALRFAAREAGFEPRVLDAVEETNETQKQVLFERIRAELGSDLGARTIAVWGLAFKPNTTDMREAPSIPLIRDLSEAGATVRAFDPEANQAARPLFDNYENVQIEDDAYAILEGADALVLVTEWRSFWSPDFQRMKQAMKSPVIFDGRNIYPPELLSSLGFVHHSIGRPAPLQTRDS